MTRAKLKVYQLEANPVCSPYRLIYPGNAINRLSDVEVKLFRDFGQREYDELSSQGDLFIIQRMAMVPDLAELIDDLNGRGILVVYEIDDDLLHLDPASRQAAMYPADYATQIERCIRACQCVQCATTSLAASLAAIHREIAVLENQLEDVPAFGDKPERGTSIIVGYAAGNDHGHDWPTVGDAYNRAIAALASRGVTVDTWIIGDPDIHASIESPRKRLLPPLSRDQYMQFLAAIDISIMPLKDGVFNRSKSDVKYLESAAAGTPVIASDVAYGRTIKHGETGLLFRDENEFASGLMRVACDRHLAQRLAKAAYGYVRDQRLINQHAPQWAAVYKGWHARRDELLHRSKGQAL